MVAEIYSPPRVTRAAKLLPSLGLAPGLALDVTTVNAMGGSHGTLMRKRSREKPSDSSTNRNPGY